MRSRFSTQDVSELTRSSVRQIDYWARTGLLKPSAQEAAGRGSKRRYTFKDVVAAQTIQQLRAGCCPLQKIRRAVKYLRSHYPDKTNAQTLSRLTLLTNGVNVYMLTDEHQVMDVLSKQLVWSVPLGNLILDTERRVSEIPTEWVDEVRVNRRVFHLEVRLDEESGEYSAQCRELPGAIEQGRTRIEAVSNGREAVQSVLTYLERIKGTGAARVASR